MSRILLVDDDKKTVARNRATLESAGNLVTTAATTMQALDAIRRDKYDVVVTEAMLDGGLAGFDLVRSLRRRSASLPIVMLTKVDEYFTPKQLRAQDRDGWLPVDRYLQKPVMPAVLLYEVEHLARAAA